MLPEGLSTSGFSAIIFYASAPALQKLLEFCVLKVPWVDKLSANHNRAGRPKTWRLKTIKFSANNLRHMNAGCPTDMHFNVPSSLPFMSKRWNIQTSIHTLTYVCMRACERACHDRKLSDCSVRRNKTFSHADLLMLMWKFGFTRQTSAMLFPLLLCSLSVMITRLAIYWRITTTQRPETNSWLSTCRDIMALLLVLSRCYTRH